jgi:GNAT superfamily N-acetyltransferase
MSEIFSVGPIKGHAALSPKQFSAPKGFDPDEPKIHGKKGEYEIWHESYPDRGYSEVTAHHVPSGGSAVGRITYNTAEMGHEGLIEDLSVDKEHRGRGLKKAMLKHARNVADVGADYHPYR